MSDIVRWLRDSQHHNEKLRTTVLGASEAAEFYQRAADEIVRLRALASDMEELLREGRSNNIPGTSYDKAWDSKCERVLGVIRAMPWATEAKGDLI